ncbi:MAG: GGDEF domain-containing protein [Fimbriiglobus sp.]|nr:GGDEF domain-containing protein [Fimbriiglobus sp.]
MPDSLSILTQTAQMVGVLVVTVLFWPIVRLIRERYLLYWAWGWALAAVGLVALFFSFQYPQGSPRPPVVALRATYCLGGYGFGFLLWAGSRTFVTGRAVRRRDLLWLVPPVGYGVTAPALGLDLSHMFGWHAGIMAAFFLAALWQTRQFRPAGRSAAGLRVYRWGLFGLFALFAHYAFLLVYHRFFMPPGTRLPHLDLASLYDVTLQAALGLGMVSIATERMRAELEEKNRRLAVAAAELEQAARTDLLTGLLNRRGLAAALARPDQPPTGCVASIDVNDLKPLNDSHGHAAGDVVLQLVARALRTLFRVTDPILRLGGDEFAVVMPGGSVAELTRRLNLLDAALRNQRLPGVAEVVDVRVAWGVAVYTTADGVGAALAAADEAMYEQKRERKVG